MLLFRCRGWGPQQPVAVKKYVLCGCFCAAVMEADLASRHLTVSVWMQAYAVAVTRLVMKDTPYKAAVLAASILSELKYENAPHVFMLKVSPYNPRILAA